jgi:quercetin dioxygenase-like cupin family protein
MDMNSIVDVNQLIPICPKPPEKVEFHLADNIFVKMISLPEKGYICSGHKHTFDHTSFVASGSIRVWKDGILDKDYHSPTGVFIEKNVEHKMLALEDNTLFFCIHNTHGFPEDELEEHLVIKG